jgi:2-C-methyl-D-erythritol 2,4-cyclodiphosphate synthase
MEIKVGHGIDIHQLKSGELFYLGGVKIESDIGILGHSDGDIVIHSIVDAILGALSKGDIGTFFPSSDPSIKDVSSKVFLKKTLDIMNDNEYKINNIDINIVLQKPHLSSYIYSIRQNLSSLIGIDIETISVKATTTDYLGFIGEGKGIMSTATLLLIKNDES